MFNKLSIEMFSVSTTSMYVLMHFWLWKYIAALSPIWIFSILLGLIKPNFFIFWLHVNKVAQTRSDSKQMHIFQQKIFIAWVASEFYKNLRLHHQPFLCETLFSVYLARCLLSAVSANMIGISHMWQGYLGGSFRSFFSWFLFPVFWRKKID